MAKYTITYKCGHEGVVTLFGKTSERDRKLSWMSDNLLCEECKQQELAQHNADAATENAAIGLPVLEGSEKQVAWAETIRQQAFEAFLRDDAVKEVLSHGRCYASQTGVTPEQVKTSPYSTPDKNQELFRQLIDDMFKMQIKASWWIDHRAEQYGRRPNVKNPGDYNEILEYLFTQWGEQVKASTVYHPIETLPVKPPQDVFAEATVYPEQPITEAVVEIKVLDTSVQAITEKHEKFRTLVKGLGYSWNDHAWERVLTSTNGTPQDRAAELGNALLNAGFPIRIMDAEIRQQAIDGTFTPEQTRWIYARTHGEYAGRFAIQWGRHEDYYNKARQLPGAKWSKPSMVVKSEHFNEVEEFATLFDFKFSTSGQQLLDEAKATRAAAQVVTPAKPEQIAGKDGLKEILNSSDEVLDELQD